VLRRITEPSPVRVVLIFLDRVDHTPRLTYSPIWYPGRENVTCHVDPSLVVKVPKFLKALDKNLGCFVPSLRLFIDTMRLVSPSRRHWSFKRPPFQMSSVH